MSDNHPEIREISSTAYHVFGCCASFTVRIPAFVSYKDIGQILSAAQKLSSPNCTSEALIVKPTHILDINSYYYEFH